jgi:hypothetical protein
MMLFLVLQMVQCGMGRCGMNSADPRDADEKLITEDEIVPVPKVVVMAPNSHDLEPLNNAASAPRRTLWIAH